jgi:hypothetical protein
MARCGAEGDKLMPKDSIVGDKVPAHMFFEAQKKLRRERVKEFEMVPRPSRMQRISEWTWHLLFWLIALHVVVVVGWQAMKWWLRGLQWIMGWA